MEYFAVEGCAGQFFRCEKLRATLSASSCAERWRQAALRGAPDRLSGCKGCEIGAGHAGAPIVKSSPLYEQRICSRCHRPSCRLIHDTHCPSCYNRGREHRLGRNAKGTRPIKSAILHPVTIRYCASGRVSEFHADLAVDATEAVVAVLRSTPGEVVFGFRPSGVLRAQAGLF